MNKRLLFFVFAWVIILTLALAACKSLPLTGLPPILPPAPFTETPIPVIGSPSHPIQVIFSPSADADLLVSSGQIMTDALKKSTGLTFEVSVPVSYTAAIHEMCASPADTMGFLPSLPYVLASKMCGVKVAFQAVRFGYDVFWTEILVPRESDIDSLEDLSGKKWGYGDPGFTTDYLVPLVMFNESGINPGKQVETGGHGQSVQALYNGEVDFVTTYYTPPTNIDTGEPVWSEEFYDISDDLVQSCNLAVDRGAIVCANLRLRDARAHVRATSPDVVQKLRILAISPSVPNDTVSFGPEFPADLRAKIGEALIAFTKTEPWAESLGNPDSYNWSGITPAEDAEYDIIRAMVEATWPELGITNP